jgi:hypothetical protein
MQIHCTGCWRGQVVDASISRMTFLNPVAQGLETLLLPFFPFAHDDRSTFKDTTPIAMILSRFPFLIRNLSSFSPRKVVKVPEGVERQHKIPQWEGNQVD